MGKFHEKIHKITKKGTSFPSSHVWQGANVSLTLCSEKYLKTHLKEDEQICTRNSASGRQAYNAYLGKHKVRKGMGDVTCGITLPSPNSVYHFGISSPNWFMKA